MTSKKKAFNKGDLVTHITEWKEGQVTFRHAIVHSCGLKRMILTDAVSGEEMRLNYRPENGTKSAVNLRAGTTYERMTDEEARAKGLEHAAALYESHMAFYDRRIADPTDNRVWPERTKLEAQGPSSISHTEAMRLIGVDHKTGLRS